MHLSGRLLLFCQGMEIGLLMFKTSFSIESLALPFRELLITILSIPHCTMFSYFQLDSLDGISGFLIMSWKIRGMHNSDNLLAWKSIFALTSTFAPSLLSQTISFWLASSFRSMSVKPELLLSRSASLSLEQFSLSLGLRYIRAW